MKLIPRMECGLVSVRLSVLWMIVAIFASGCAGLDAKRMVPEIRPESSGTGELNVRVMPVAGGKDGEFGSFARANNEQFTDALIFTLRKSQLFGTVDAKTGDIDLYATIQSQGVGTQFMGGTATMVVSYRFVDRSGEVIWLQSYESEFTSTALAGATRTVESREGAVRENLSAFIQGIRERRPTRGVEAAPTTKPVAALDTDARSLRRELVASWIVQVLGDTRTRTLTIRGAEKGGDGVWILDATYGWSDASQRPVKAELTATEGGYRLEVNTPAQSLILAESADLKVFAGTFRAAGAAAKRVVLDRTTGEGSTK